MKDYVLSDVLRDAAEGETTEAMKTVRVCSVEEFRTHLKDLPHQRQLLKDFGLWENVRAEMYGACILGLAALPVFEPRLTRFERIGFYLTPETLILVGNGEKLQTLVSRLKENQFAQTPTPAAIFSTLLNNWIEESIAAVQKIEQDLIAVEDEFLTNKARSQLPYRRLILARKDLLQLHAFFYQLTTTAAAIRANSNQMLTDDECQLFAGFSDRAERVHHHVEALREYVMQIREMYQLQIQLKQAAAMRILAVVSVIFLPLTLLVGWYGMNFEFMPELHWPWAYPAICLTAAAIIIGELLYFRKKGLL